MSKPRSVLKGNGHPARIYRLLLANLGHILTTHEIIAESGVNSCTSTWISEIRRARDLPPDLEIVREGREDEPGQYGLRRKEPAPPDEPTDEEIIEAVEDARGPVAALAEEFGVKTAW